MYKQLLPLAALACLTSPALAQETPPAPVASPVAPEASPEPTPDEPELKFRGLLWNSYNYNFNQPSNGLNAFRGYDFDAQKLKLDLLDLDLQYGVDMADQVGVRLELTGGYSMPRVDAAANLFRNEVTGISNTAFDIRQMFVTYKTNDGLRFDLGKFATIFGYEGMPGVDTINPNATIAWSNTYSPYTHTGLRVSYPITDRLTATGLFVTGSDTFTDNNQVPSFGAQLSYKPVDEVTLTANFMTGAERYADNNDVRRLFDFVGSFQVHEQVKLGFHTIAGAEDYPTGLAYWNSLVLYNENQLTDNFYLNLRYEWYNDPFGVRTGVGQNLRGFTITPRWDITEDLTVRLDFRIDDSSQQVFDRRGRLVNSQPTIYFNQVLRF